VKVVFNQTVGYFVHTLDFYLLVNAFSCSSHCLSLTTCLCAKFCIAGHILEVTGQSSVLLSTTVSNIDFQKVARTFNSHNFVPQSSRGKGVSFAEPYDYKCLGWVYISCLIWMCSSA
jgi:hypothetical protein